MYNEHVEQKKEEIIHALLNMDIYKMPDGRQLYQVPLNELIQEYNVQKDCV